MILLLFLLFWPLQPFIFINISSDGCDRTPVYM